jgi:CubicO group peptidase (beta-lactamase class C family)
MKRIYFTTILFLSLITGFSQSQEKDYTEAFKLIEVWLDAQKDFEQLPGITAIIVKDQEVLWQGAFGLANKEDSVKAEPSTIFSICSISKLFTSVAIMKLYEEGKLRLDDDIKDLLPEYNLKQKYSESMPVTVRSLMTHSSGLPRESNFPYWTPPDFPFPSREEINGDLSKQETLYPASAYFQYSNLGMTLLGEIVEEISEMPYDDYIQQNIIEPLGLKNTRTELPKDLYGNKLAYGYSSVNRKLHREKIDFFQANGVKPAAGFSSNVIDLGKFASWQFRLLDTTTTEILKSSTLKYMQNVHWTDPDWKTTWGLGFSVVKGEDGDKWVGHGGSCPGYRTILQLNPKTKLAFSVMINAGGTDPGKYVKGMNAIMGKVKTVNRKDSVANNLGDYTGYYSEQPWGSEVYASTWEGKLVLLDLPSDTPANSMTFFKHIKDDTFRRIRDDEELGETLVFERDDDGQITRFKRHGNYTFKLKR